MQRADKTSGAEGRTCTRRGNHQKQLEEYKYGPADDPTVTQGPLSSKKQFDRVKGYIELGLQEGAEW